MYICWDVQDRSNEVDGAYTVSLHCTRGQTHFCSSLVSKKYSLLPNSYHTFIFTGEKRDLLATVMTVISSVTLNFVDCASVFAVWCKRNINNGQFMIQGQFQMHFYSSLINYLKNTKRERSFLV